MSKESTSLTIPPFAPAAPTQLTPEFSAEDYISCEEAGKILAVRRGKNRVPISDRRVQEIAARGILRRTTRKDPKRGNQETIVVLREDVLRYKEEREKPVTLPATHIEALPQRRRELAAPADTVHPNSIPPADPWAWLTLAEAAALTRLPESKIRDLYEHGNLAGLDCGPRLGGSLRFRRSDLEKIEGERRN